MNPLRKLVAGPKVRTVQNGYDLDLTYITKRVIAMAFPGSGFEALYRNSIQDVAAFLTEKHGDSFMIFNLSGRKYDYSKFKGKVKEWDWEDHQAPALYTIFQICQQATSFMQQNTKNVIVAHCNHGKGRTGTIIVSLLLFLNFFNDVDEALRFYAKQRFEREGYGVTQPCQIRYVRYFNQLLKEKTISIIPYTLKEVRFKGNCNLQDCFIQAKNVRGKQEVLQSKTIQDKGVVINSKNLMMGDIFFEIILSSLFGDKQIARINFNTIFIPSKTKTISFPAHQISPDKLLTKHKDRVSQDFVVQMVFNLFCGCDLAGGNVNLDCPCQNQMAAERMYWQKIGIILKTYNTPSKQKTVQLLYGGNIHEFKEEA